MNRSRYSIDDIVVPPIPPVVSGTDGRCSQTYLYRFAAPIAAGKDLGRLASALSHRLRVRVRASDDGAFVEIPITVELTRLGERELLASVSSKVPEEEVVWLFGLYQLPQKLERAIGLVESICGGPREMWPPFRRLGGTPKGRKA